LPSDGFSLVDPLDPDLGNCDLVMEAVGHHYRASASSFDLREGEQGTILWERDNPYDSSAVAFCFQGRIAGYVNRLQAPVFCQWLNSRQIDVQVDRVNGRLGRPRLFVFVQVRPRLLCAA